MGMEHTVSYSDDAIRFWPRVTELLAQHDFPVQIRMIDGELALPDEMPNDSWKELRLGTPQGMLTLRRADKKIQVVTWGNADLPLRQAWNALAWAVAEVNKGQVQTDKGAKSSAAFREMVELPEVFSTK